ncbi:MAG: hypothetical protein ACM3Z4_17385 [Hyphomicrobiales bacterium]|jgi:hypothetical protein
MNVLILVEAHGYSKIPWRPIPQEARLAGISKRLPDHDSRTFS